MVGQQRGQWDTQVPRVALCVKKLRGLTSSVGTLRSHCGVYSVGGSDLCFAKLTLAREGHNSREGGGGGRENRERTVGWKTQTWGGLGRGSLPEGNQRRISKEQGCWLSSHSVQCRADHHAGG